MKLRILLLGSLATLSVAVSDVYAAPSCELTRTATISSGLSSQLLDEVSIIGGDVRPLELLARIGDITGDGFKEILSYEGGNTVAIRNGVTLDEIRSGAFPFSLPTGSYPTQMGLIGDLQRDGSEEIGISLRYPSGGGASAIVFSGATRAAIESFPNAIAGLPQKLNQDEPNYPNPPPASRMGVSAQVADVEGARKLVYIDPHVHGGTLVFRTTCIVLDQTFPCFDIRTYRAGGITPRNLGVKSAGFEATPGGARTLLLADPSADSLPVQFNGSSDVLKPFAGAVAAFSGDSISLLRRGDRPNARMNFDLTITSGPILGQPALLSSSPTDGISTTDTAEFFVMNRSNGNLVRRYTPQLTEENVDLGYAIDGGDDLTGDGVADVVVSAPGERNEGRVRVYTPSNDYFNRMILRVAGSTIRFGHGLASVGPNRIVVADGAGKLYSLRLSGEQVGGTDAVTCAPPSPNVPPTPTPIIGVSNTELIELRTNAGSVSSLIGGLKYQQGRSGRNAELLRGIKRRTDRVGALLASPSVQARDARLNAALKRDYARRAKVLQDAFVKGSRTQRRDAQKRLTSKSNEIVRITSAAIAG